MYAWELVSRLTGSLFATLIIDETFAESGFRFFNGSFNPLSITNREYKLEDIVIELGKPG